MALRFSNLLQQHPTNSVANVATSGSTNKEWANNYHAFRNMNVHTTIDQHGDFTAFFEPWFLPEYHDNRERGNEWCYLPNKRQWRLKSEQDIKEWFHTEIVNPVLSGWTGQPIILQQSEVSPLDGRSAEKVDNFYTIVITSRLPFLVGEYKKNLIDRDQWQGGRLTSDDQRQLSRELRGYCIKYKCPQGYCFDGEILISWQLRAVQEEGMAQYCPIDVWVIPRGSSVTTYRYALDRLFSQALRRCQGEVAVPNAQVAGYVPDSRPFYSGEPWFRIQGETELQNLNQYGYSRAVDTTYGAFYWRYQTNDILVSGGKVWDTMSIWGTT